MLVFFYTLDKEEMPNAGGISITWEYNTLKHQKCHCKRFLHDMLCQVNSSF